MGAGLITRSAPGTQACLPPLPAPARLAAAGRATTLPTRKGLAYCRTDGLVGALPAPSKPLFSALLEAGSAPDREPAAEVRLDLQVRANVAAYLEFQRVVAVLALLRRERVE